MHKIDKNIEFLEFQKNIDDFFSSIDCLVMPSVEESFGMVALEAMSCKLPCIVSSVCGASEIISDKEDGFIFEMDSIPHINLANKMEEIIKSKEIEKLRQNAFKTAEKYSWERFYKTFLQEIKDKVFD